MNDNIPLATIHQRIGDELDKRDWTWQRLAQEAEVSTSIIYNYRDTGRATAETLDKFLVALELTARLVKAK